MKDKIGKLAKGIIDMEAPAVKLLPERLDASFVPGRPLEFDVELRSANGITIKGVWYGEDPRLSGEAYTFVGRRIQLRFSLDGRDLPAGARHSGNISFLTNAGVFLFLYEVQCPEKPDAEAENIKNPLSEKRSIADSPLYFTVDENGTLSEEDPLVSLLAGNPTKDDALLEAIVRALIRNKDYSPLSYALYKEAIRREYGITRLYESYLMARPQDASEQVPREVLLYFSYDHEPEAGLREKLYAAVLNAAAEDEELFTLYESRMSRFAMQNALEGRINENLRGIYERMIYPGMIDTRAALKLPDILKCSRIRVHGNGADQVVVNYPELKEGVRAPLRNGISYVPVYFEDARISLFRIAEDGSAEEVTEELSCTKETLFSKPQLLTKCFALCPGHPMLLLSAAREIEKRGILNSEEKQIAVRALTELPLEAGFRERLIGLLSETDGDLRWTEMISPASETPQTRLAVARALLRGKRPEAAWRCISSGYAFLEDAPFTMELLDQMIREDRIPMRDGAPDPLFLQACDFLMQKPELTVTDAVLGYLCYAYEGPVPRMYAVLSEALKRGVKVFELPERILSMQLFTGVTEHMDECFEAYLEHCCYTEFLLLAYLVQRSADYFLREEEVIGSIFFEALRGYLKNQDRPEMLPVILLLALTKHDAEAERLSSEEAELCQRLTDILIGQNLVFAYTKKLRKKIRIPREISDRFYIEYRGDPETAPKLLVRILPDEDGYHTALMKRVYRNIYVMSTLLFMGDELHYLIYDTPSAMQPSEEGMIKVRKFHRQKDDRFETINYMLKALQDRDTALLQENMLKYIEKNEMIRTLYTMEP